MICKKIPRVCPVSESLTVIFAEICFIFFVYFSMLKDFFLIFVFDYPCLVSGVELIASVLVIILLRSPTWEWSTAFICISMFDKLSVAKVSSSFSAICFHPCLCKVRFREILYDRDSILQTMENVSMISLCRSSRDWAASRDCFIQYSLFFFFPRRSHQVGDFDTTGI